ncbi:MAG: methyl-accepting chemotaxis protein [Thermodesulfobacteriota bacterium]|nr:methyl-accepting chemotaxis protein [Thermodesulfobacteriota bacterium]
MKKLSRFFSGSLRVRILFGLLLSLVPMLAIVGVSYYSARNTALNNSKEVMKLLTQSGAKEINGFIKAQQSAFLDWTREDLCGVAIEFHTIDELKDHFNAILQRHQWVSMLALTDMEGKVLQAAVGEHIKGVKPDFFKDLQIKEASRFMGTGVRSAALVRSKLTRRLGCRFATFVFSYQARDTAGNPNGLLLAYLALSNCQNTVRSVVNEIRTSGLPGARVGILDVISGMFLVHSDEAMIGGRCPMSEALKSCMASDDIEEARKFELQEQMTYVGFAPLADPSRLFESTATPRETMRLAGFVPEKDIMAGVWRITWTSIGIAVIGTVAIVLIGLFIGFTITRPISLAVSGLRDMEDDLTKRLEVRSEDEIGELVTWFNTFIERLQHMIKDVAANAEGLNTASSDLFTLSRDMASSADKMASQSDTVAGAAEEMSTNINAIATATEQLSANVGSVSSTAEEMSQNVNAVASSIEEMSMTLNDVAAGAQGGAEIAQKATAMSQSATDTMNVLGEAAEDIGEVTALIKRIAEQTNLLALNATIEAASAGDAGKGFAVVAGEIKELANQSAKAAEDIAKRIEGAQANTEEAVKVIADISGVIDNVNESSMVITSAVDQQRVMANEISGNVQQTTSGINNIASSMADVAKGANDMAKSGSEAAKGVIAVSSNIQGVSKAAEASNAGVKQMETSAGQLAKMSERLQEMVGRFKVDPA